MKSAHIKEVEDTMLQDLFGSASLTKVLDFLLENRFWEYTKKDISENSGISRVQFYRLWPILEKYEIIKESRKIGATSLYVTNFESPITRKLESMSLEIAKFINRKIVKEELNRINETEGVDSNAVLKTPTRKMS